MKTSTEYRQQFEELVERAEQEIAEQPAAYKRRLKWLALLGYAVILGLLVLLLVLTGGTVWLALTSSALLLLLFKSKLIFVLAGLVWVLVRSLFVRIRAPKGYELSRAGFPHVWAEVDKLGKELGTPPIHNIILTSEMNAAIAQTPRLGIIGPYKNTLILGLELLFALTTGQARSVLAHELAHLSGDHSKFSGWIYRLRQSWTQVNGAFHASNVWGTGLLRRFLDWYAPYFSGYSYVLARDNEYEADALAGKLTSHDTAASALVAVHVYGELTGQQFWRSLYDQAYTQAQPETAAYTRLQQFYQQFPIHEDEFKRHLRTALTRKTDPADTHPALMERLKALKATGIKPETDTCKAAVWLGEKTVGVIQHFNQQWVSENTAQWLDFHQRAQTARQDVDKLAARDYHALAESEKWQLASLTERFLPARDALPLYQQYAASYPEDTDADLAIGRLLLVRDNADGICHLEKAMCNPALCVYAAEEAWRYYVRQQQPQQAGDWLIRLESAADLLEEARQERADIQGSDTLMAPNALDKAGEELVQELLGTLPQHGKVQEVWLAQKKVRHFQDNPLFVLAVKVGGFVYDEGSLQRALLDATQTQRTVFVVNTASHKKLAKKVMAVGRQIY
ncbi:MAG: M48 family metallopeptidase [Thiothrix sp.]|uniref:M48 family metallopeptidase n=1 Tax=Thiothrix sp. TaxID=1032 RepID=UPI0026153510|nr:M48 family metallopeptidase [Thiothrix sp.]MDD5394983.1 M48 family metallopeptidase [Thiothrix sp.]